MPDEKTEETVEETKEEKTGETKEEIVEEKKEEAEEVVEDDEETAKAVELYKALQGPNAIAIIEKLAKQAKLIGDDSGLGKKEQKKAIVEVLKEELGDEYGYLAEKFGKAIEKILSQELADVQRKFSQVEEIRHKKESDAALDKFYRDHPDVKNHEKQIFDLMHKLPQGQDTDTYEYLSMLYSLAKSGKMASSSVRKAVEKMKENAKDANLASSDVAEDRVRKGPQHPTLEEALNAAVKGVQWE